MARIKWSGMKGESHLRRRSGWVLQIQRCRVCHQPRYAHYVYKDMVTWRTTAGWTTRGEYVPLRCAPSDRPKSPGRLRCQCRSTPPAQTQNKGYR